MPAIAPKKKPIKQERCSTDRAVKKPAEIDSEAASIPSSSRNGTDGSGVAGRSAVAKSGSSEGNTTAGAAAEKTVFISNLDFKLPKERIMEVFPNAKEVRFIHRGMSKLHKGFGYVDFETVEEACAALSKDRHLIDGRPMYVSENRPHEHRGEHSEFRYATNLEKNKIFVGNVHYDATEEQLKEVFTAYGVIRDVRIVTHKSGRSKGFAYIEFEDEASASAAVKAATEEIVLLGKNFALLLRLGESRLHLERKLSVALSNPPKKKDPIAAAAAPSRIASSSVSHQRNKIDLLVPRALARSKPETNSSKSTAHQGSEETTNKGGVEDQQKESGKPIATKLSNDQFRSMFSK
ncbi:unnamed protein product [Anisakis simplex]|uniref:RNA-binding protein 4F (inferred by orthology to a D. melanogaster protein) n=1 Tax=Anisakis simplex TaxID=6269 RepID=A0A0M3J1M6_ANISI|nr:unnamed protein product [Anisakis simplex]